MIRVLHVLGGLNRGGAEMRTVELMSLLSEKGVHFDFCTLMCEDGHLDERVRYLGGKIYTCLLKPNVWSFGRRFVKLLKQGDYDIVHSHGNCLSGYIVRLAHRAGIRSRIVHFRNTFDGKTLTLPRRLYNRFMFRLIDKHATGIVAVCRGAMSHNLGADWQKDSRTQVVYNGLDVTPYKIRGDERKDLIKELALPDNSKLVISVANIHRQKAHDVLLEAAAKVIVSDQAFHILLAGDGILRSDMEAKAKTLNISDHVHFLGVRDDVPRLLKGSDCFVLSSRWEGLPGVVLEAIAANLPVVATDLPGVREISAYTDLISIVGVEDSNAIAEGIVNVFERIDINAYEPQPFPEEFSLQHCANNIFKVYTNQLS